MHWSKFILAAMSLLSIVVPVTSQAQALGYDERCHIIEGNGVRIDECDGSKLLRCKDGRCQCADPANQIYTYRIESTVSPQSRRKRQILKPFTKAISKSVGGGKKHKDKKKKRKHEEQEEEEKVYSCYSRAGAPCNLNYNNVEETTEPTPPATPATQTEFPSTSAGESTTAPENTTPTLVTTTRTDVSKLPKCVQNAVCRITTGNTADDSGAAYEHVERTDNDPRVGICDCEIGYLRTSKDLCKEIPQQEGQTN